MTANPTTTEIIESLRSAGHSVECPITGRVLLDGVDVTGALEATHRLPAAPYGDVWTLASAVTYLLYAAGEES